MSSRPPCTACVRPIAVTILLALLAACSDGQEEGSGTGGSTDADATTKLPGELPILSCESRALPPLDVEIGGLLRPPSAQTHSDFAKLVFQRELQGDPRKVLPGVRAGAAFASVAIVLPAGAGPFSQRIDLRLDRYRFTKRVVVAPRIRLDDWVEIEPIELQVQHDDVGRYAELVLDLARFSSWHGRARIKATVYAAPPTTSFRYRTESMQVAHDVSWLQFAVGIHEAAWTQGPVRFRLQACEGERCSCLHEEILDPGRESGRGWQDRMLRLAELGGRSLTFVFESALVSPAPGAFHLAQWELPQLLVESDEPRGRRQNVLLISLDTLRADHLGAYGYARETSPFMSGALLARSTVFDHAVAPSTTTAPSHMTLFTSLQPSVHGVASNLRQGGLPKAIPTLAEMFFRAGYATGSVNENGAISRRLGFGRGFDYYRVFRTAAITPSERSVGKVFDAGRRFIERHSHRAWLLFLHTYEVHYPYTPPARYGELFAEGDDPHHPDNQRLGARARDHSPVRYDREIRHADTALMRLLESLEAQRLLDDTLVIVTSDHGEAFLEHHYLGHGSDAHQETVHVPLFMSGRGIEAGRRISEPVGLIDLMPTLLEWLEIPSEDVRMSGRSFVALLQGTESGHDWQTRAIISEAWHPTATLRTGTETIIPPTLAVRRGHYKLIRYKGAKGARYELFDLAADPGEQSDLYSGGGPVADQLRAIADAHEAESAALVMQMGLPPLRIDSPSLEDIDPDRLEALRALGYLE